MEFMRQLGMSNLFVPSYSGKVKRLSGYMQFIDKDFTIEEMEQFISDVILKSDLMANTWLPKKDNDSNKVAIHIRNGDFLKIPWHNPFNRIDYLDKAIHQHSIEGI